MGVPPAGSVVLTPFPFSDLTESRLRPALVIVPVDYGDWMLCQITSNPYTDFTAVRISPADFEYGALRQVSFARPGKLFTGSRTLSQGVVGRLKPDKFAEVVEAIVSLIRDGS